jgi:hypothetical protein
VYEINLFLFPLNISSVVSLDGEETFVKAVPNNYEYVIEKKLVPTEYKSVLPAALVIFKNFFRENRFCFLLIDITLKLNLVEKSQLKNSVFIQQEFIQPFFIRKIILRFVDFFLKRFENT